MSTEILPPSQRAIVAARERLQAGDVVALPTETVYGLAGVATDEAAVTRIFSAKERPSFDPLIVHVPHLPRQRLAAMVEAGWVDRAPLDLTAVERTEALLDTFWPGPLTLVLPAGPTIPGIVTSGLDTVAVRCPDHPVFQAVLEAVGEPMAAPSANRFGRLSPTSAGDVLEELGGRIPLILDGGPTRVGVESTIVRVEADGSVTLLRAGGTPVEAIERAVGCGVRRAAGDDQSAPGRMLSHYAPGHRLRPLPSRAGELTPHQVEGLLAGTDPTAPIGVLVFDPMGAHARERLQALFGRPLELRELGAESGPAARALFRSMRELDRSAGVLLFAEPVSRTHELWPAIAERLSKAMA